MDLLVLFVPNVSKHGIPQPAKLAISGFQEVRPTATQETWCCFLWPRAPVCPHHPFPSGSIYLHTVDGQNPAPVAIWFILLFTGLYPSQVVQDFVHQQYYPKQLGPTWHSLEPVKGLWHGGVLGFPLISHHICPVFHTPGFTGLRFVLAHSIWVCLKIGEPLVWRGSLETTTQ